MKIKYDKKADAKYISIKKGRISYTKREKDLLVDYSKKGEILGLEILNASKNSINIHTIKEKLVGFEVVKSIPFVIDKDKRDYAALTAKLPNAFIGSFSVVSPDKVFA